MHTYLFIHKSFPYLCVCVCACVCLIETEVWGCRNTIKAVWSITQKLSNNSSPWILAQLFIAQSYTMFPQRAQAHSVHTVNDAHSAGSYSTFWSSLIVPGLEHSLSSARYSNPKNNWENSSFIFQWAPNTISTFFFFFFFGIMLGSPTLHG